MAGRVFPSTEQIEALDRLKDYDNRLLLSWLALARSIEPGFRHCPGPNTLSPVVVHSILVLRDCEDEKLNLWLDMTRSYGKITNNQSCWYF